MERLASAMGRTFCLSVGLMVESFEVEDKYSNDLSTGIIQSGEEIQRVYAMG